MNIASRLTACNGVDTLFNTVKSMSNYTVSQKKTGPLLRFEITPTNCAIIIIMISWENRQKVLNIVVCYGLTIFHKTGYQLSRIMHPHIGHVRRLSFCVVRHQRSSRLTSGRLTTPTSTLLTTAFGAVYSSVCTRSRWKMWMNWSSAWWRSGLAYGRPLLMTQSTNGEDVRVKGQHFEHLL